MARTSRYSEEVRERAVRMVFEHRDEYDSEWEAIGSIAKKIGCTSETLRKGGRRTEVDTGHPFGKKIGRIRLSGEIVPILPGGGPPRGVAGAETGRKSRAISGG